MTSNSIAPSSRTIEIYKSGSDWKVDLFEPDGTTPIGTTTIGTVAITAGVILAPIDLRALSGGHAANGLRIKASADSFIKVVHVAPLLSTCPIVRMAVSDGEYVSEQIQTLFAIEANVTRVSISYG